MKIQLTDNQQIVLNFLRVTDVKGYSYRDIARSVNMTSATFSTALLGLTVKGELVPREETDERTTRPIAP